MQKARERLFFGVSDMTAWKFAAINMLNTLNLLHDKKIVHGRVLQKVLWELFDHTWTPGNELTYKILNTYEYEGYVKSSWQEDPDPDKRYIRGYVITDKGKEYLKTLKLSFSDTLTHMQKVFNISLDFIWGNRTPQKKVKSSVLISSSKFTALNLLTLLDNQKKLSAPWFYAKEIKKALSSRYDGLWEPSDGVLYPLLSRYSTNGLLQSSWLEDGKKRSIREYAITLKGQEYLSSLLSPESGLKNKIIQLEQLCYRSNEYICGNSVTNTNKVLTIIDKQVS